MSRTKTPTYCGFYLVWMTVITAAAYGQQPGAGVRGRVKDESGALVQGAVVTVFRGENPVQQVATDESGEYSVRPLPPGRYEVDVERPGFETSRSPRVELAAGRAGIVDVTLRLRTEIQEITVRAENSLSTDPSANAGALILKGEDTEALSDDPDELLDELKALAGPPSGLKGSQLYVDGFTADRLPPKESIREVRINQNPFSAEYDRMGLGRIEVFTKPGTDRFHGMVSAKYSNSAVNSRNPYAVNKPPYRSEQLEGDLHGRLSGRSSFFTDFEQRRSADSAVINASVLDSGLQVTPMLQTQPAPRRDAVLGQRFDVQLSRNHTMAARYGWMRADRDNSGIGSFDLRSRAYDDARTEHTVQITETATLSSRTINETRFQFIRASSAWSGDSSQPAVAVLDSFTGGGAQVGRSFRLTNSYWLANDTSYLSGTHMVKFGARLRRTALTDFSLRDFGGAFTFAGGLAPELDSGNQMVLDATGAPVLTPITSLERYRRTLLFGQMGFTQKAIRDWGGGASQFSIVGGEPPSALTVADIGIYLQDDWRVKSGLTLSAGLRYETQSHTHDLTDAAPRLGFAWAPGARRGKSMRTVIRGGAGFFYERLGQDVILQADRFNGVTQRRFIVRHPDFFPDVPSVDALASLQQPPTVWQVDRSLRTPRVFESALSIERQLPAQLTLSVTFIHAHAVHMFGSRNINAPLPGTLDPADPSGGLRPYGPRNIFQYESNRRLNQNQAHVALTRSFSARLGAFGYYSYGRAFTDSDGPNSFPANQYDLRSEYGRSNIDIRHSYVVGSSMVAPLGLKVSPFVVGRSGAPFDIVTGVDTNGDALFNDRPAFAAAQSAKAGIMATPFGTFDPNPGSGQALIPRNYGEGASYINLNIRVSRTFGLGSVSAFGKKSKKVSKKGGGDGGKAGMILGADESSLQPMLQDTRTEQRFNLTLSATARNVFNHVNPGVPVGNLSSSFFGLSNWLASSAAPDEEALGNNRRIVFRLRLGF